MTSRMMLSLDRAATLVLALALIVVGAGGIWWWTGDSPLPAALDASGVRQQVDSGWWPWASAAAGVVLILLGLRWIAAHVTNRKVKRLHLKGSGAGGRLDVAGSKVAGAAAAAFSDTLGVRSARGSVIRDRGQLVAHLSATIEPEADLRLIAARADVVSAQLAQALDRDDARCSVELKVAARGRHLPRAK